MTGYVHLNGAARMGHADEVNRRRGTRPRTQHEGCEPSGLTDRPHRQVTASHHDTAGSSSAQDDEEAGCPSATGLHPCCEPPRRAAVTASVEQRRVLL